MLEVFHVIILYILHCWSDLRNVAVLCEMLWCFLKCCSVLMVMVGSILYRQKGNWTTCVLLTQIYPSFCKKYIRKLKVADLKSYKNVVSQDQSFPILVLSRSHPAIDIWTLLVMMDVWPRACSAPNATHDELYYVRCNTSGIGVRQECLQTPLHGLLLWDY